MRSATLAAVLATALLAPGVPAPASAQTGTSPVDAAADSPRVYLVTFGPGDAVWERFGHNALWIHDPERGTDRAYHYGLFDMSEEGFVLHFLQGRMTYSMGRNHALQLIEAYRRYGRDATVQELRLTSEEIRELEAFLEWNYLPENRLYRYDYFRDNCSTRIRDALDRVTGGAIRSSLESRPSPLTYRGQAVALTARDRILTTGMDLGLGPLADQPITRWDLAFIPMRLRDDLRDLTVHRAGNEVPLVASERSVPALGREDERVGVPPHETSTRGRALWLLLLGALAGGLLAAAGWLAAPDNATGRAARWTVILGGSGWGFLSGVLGLVLLALWTLTDHEFAWRNENLLQANPLALGLVALIPMALVRGRGYAAARGLAIALLGLSAVGLLIHPLPLTLHANLPIIALALPIHLGLAAALFLIPPGRRPEAGGRPATAPE